MKTVKKTWTELEQGFKAIPKCQKSNKNSARIRKRVGSDEDGD